MSVWQIQLLGGLRATCANAAIARFPSRPVAMLLARLAMQPQRRHAREELIELLWPDVELDVGRNRLRQALSTLRRLLEPPGTPPDSVLIADRQTVGLVADAVACDAAEFEQLLRSGATIQALERYRGELLPGFIDEWVDEERLRLSALYERAAARSGNVAGKASPTEPTPTRRDAEPTTAAQRGLPQRSLPSYVSLFFDRESETARVRDALAQRRLVTIAGLGGFGKTRLAVESARAAEGFDSVAFVALSELSDATLILDAIRGALRMEASEDPMAQICAFLAERDVLLVLDNFEQLVDQGTGMIVELLERLPRLRCLVTSRRTLDVPGEQALRIDPLPVPRVAMDAAEAAATPSVALFIDRARGARADFALTEDNRAALIELTRALEGLPLAIEIAASRIRTYSPNEMRAALAERFELLTRQGQRGARYGRHMSLQTTIEWSWNLLSDAEQRFFAALSVFRGGFTAAAVESVCGDGDARNRLDAFVSDSLLRAETMETGLTRFSMLDTLREFARGKLGSDEPALRTLHRAYFLQLARDAAATDLSNAEREIANLKQALFTAMDDGEPGYAIDLGVALRSYWEAHGMLPDELRLLEQAVERCARTEARLHAGLDLLAQLTLTAGDTEKARHYAQRGLEEAGNDPARRAAALVTLARVNWERDQRDQATAKSLDEALALATKAGATEPQADALRVKGLVALKHGADDADNTAANALFERAEALYRRFGEERWAHRVLLSRAGCLVGLARYDEARTLIDRCERYFAERDSAADLIAVANMIGFLESRQEHWPQAVAAGRRCVELAWDRHAHLPLAMALWNLPHPLAMLGEFAIAARLMAFAARFWERGIGPLSASDRAIIEEERKRTEKRLGARRAAALRLEGEALSLAEAVDLALTGRH